MAVGGKERKGKEGRKVGRRSREWLAMAEAQEVEVVEHVVLLSATGAPSDSDMESWASGLRALRSLPGVIQLHIGSVSHLPTSHSSSSWTHALYARYIDKPSLHAYAVHPDHIRAVSRGNHIFSDVMALDWLARLLPTSPTSLPPSRIVFLQFKPDVSREDVDTLMLGLQGAPAITFGPNFSPARARGFHWGIAAFHGSVDGDVLTQEHEEALTRICQSSEVEQSLLLDFSVMQGPSASM